MTRYTPRLKSQRTPRRPACFLIPLAIGVALLLPVTGCSESGVAITIEKTGADRPDLTGDMGTSGQINLPAEVPFNLTSFKSNEGAETAADSSAESEPIGNNGAKCSARASGGGTADANFLLGYMFDNQTGRTLHASISLELEVKESTHFGKSPNSADASANSIATTQSTEPEKAVAAAMSQLVFQIKDSNGVALHTENLAIGNADRARVYTAKPLVVVDATFEPSKGYYLAIYGSATAKSAAGKKAEAFAEIKNCNMQIKWQPGKDTGEQPDMTTGERP